MARDPAIGDKLQNNIAEKKLSIATESKAKERKELDTEKRIKEEQYMAVEHHERSKEVSETTGNPSHLGHVFNLRDPKYSKEEKNVGHLHLKSPTLTKIKNKKTKELHGDFIKEEPNNSSIK